MVETPPPVPAPAFEDASTSAPDPVPSGPFGGMPEFRSPLAPPPGSAARCRRRSPSSLPCVRIRAGAAHPVAVPPGAAAAARAAATRPWPRCRRRPAAAVPRSPCRCAPAVRRGPAAALRPAEPAGARSVPVPAPPVAAVSAPPCPSFPHPPRPSPAGRRARATGPAGRRGRDARSGSIRGDAPGRRVRRPGRSPSPSPSPLPRTGAGAAGARRRRPGITDIDGKWIARSSRGGSKVKLPRSGESERTKPPVRSPLRSPRRHASAPEDSVPEPGKKRRAGFTLGRKKADDARPAEPAPRRGEGQAAWPGSAWAARRTKTTSRRIRPAGRRLPDGVGRSGGRGPGVEPGTHPPPRR